MVDVFISYQRAERDAVEIVAEKLRALKFDVWFDEALRSGGSFDDEIAQNLKAAKAVLVCWTPAAIGSEWVRGEAAMAHGGGKLVACFLEPTELLPPFNLIHAENLMAWAGQEDDQNWLNLVSRLGEICGRQGVSAYYRVMRPDATAAELRAWAQANGADPLAERVWERVQLIEGESGADRIARERAEARTRDLKRAENAARSKALAKARGLRDPKEQNRRLLRITAALAGVAALAAGGVWYAIDSNARLRDLDHRNTAEAVRAFLSANAWNPVRADALAKYYQVEAADWAKAQAAGTIQAYDAYIAEYTRAPAGKYLSAAKIAKAQAEQIADAQTSLSRLRLFDGEASGVVDPKTYDAITLFQYRAGAVVTGTVDPDLLARLRAAVQKRVATAPDAIPLGRVGPPTENEYRAVAARLKVDGPSLKAIFKVEAGVQGGFGPDGRMLILFEPHIFSRLTAHKFDQSNPEVSYQRWGERPYPRTQAERWDQLQQAYALDPDAAYRSASYGSYQVLGSLYPTAGFVTASEYVQYMAESEANQLEIFVRYVESRGILPALQRRDWDDFARRYNGPGQITRYGDRLRQAYAEAAAGFAAPPSPAP